MTNSTSGSQSFIDASSSVAWILGAQSLPAHIDPAHPALVWDDGRRTYEQLRSRALSLATALRASGLRSGDRVAGHLLNRGETFELYFACAYAGLTFVSLSWRLTTHELGMILDDCSPGLVFTQPSVAAPMIEAAEARGIPAVVLDEHDGGSAFEAMAHSAPFAGPYETSDPHVILYTSGTTGRPKGVTMSHAGISWFALQQAAVLRIDERAVTLLIAPTFNTASINEQSIPTLLTGGTVAIHPSRGWTPARMAERIDRWGVTHSIIFPSMMGPLHDEDARSRIDLASLRIVLTGGENCPPATIARFQERWPHAHVVIGYGSTESGIVSLIAGEEIGRRPRSVGRVALGMTMRIQDDAGRVLGVDEVGEIWAAGPAVMRDYWQAPELTAETLRERWVNTGDLGRLDREGYLYLQGRSRDLIISKGQNIYPAEIEAALMAHEAVLEVAVVGLPDAEWGEAVGAVVVLAPGARMEPEVLMGFVRERLASYKKPRHVVFVPALPRNPGGKVVRSEVVDLIARAAAVGAH